MQQLQEVQDISTNNTVTLTHCSVFCLPTGVYGPLVPGYHALLIGRLSTLVTGLFGLPGVIDSYMVGEIKIMAWTHQLPCVVLAGSNVAQLILFPAAPLSAPPIAKQRGGGFGSTGVPQIFWTRCITSQCPTCQCKVTLKGKGLISTGLIDTNADVTVISKSQWPTDWPLMTVPQIISGVGGNSQSHQSQYSVQITGTNCYSQTFCAVRPAGHVGEDVLTQCGIFMQSNFI